MPLDNKCWIGMRLETRVRWSSALRLNRDSSLKMTRLQSVTLQVARGRQNPVDKCGVSGKRLSGSSQLRSVVSLWFLLMALDVWKKVNETTPGVTSHNSRATTSLTENTLFPAIYNTFKSFISPVSVSTLSVNTSASESEREENLCIEKQKEKLRIEEREEKLRIEQLRSKGYFSSKYDKFKKSSGYCSDEVLRGFKALGTEATNRDPWLIQILMQKLDTETKRLWSVKTAENDFPILKEFLEFLNVRCSSLELMTCHDSDTKVPTKSNFISGSVGQQEISNIELDAVNTTLNSSTSVNNAKCISFLPTAKTTSGCFYPRSNHWEKLEEGRSVTSGAAEFGIAHSIVSRLWRQFQTTGTAIRGFSSGRPRGTTPADDRYIVLQARRNRRQTAGEIARHRRRSLGCREHRNWRDNEWGRVLFTDESRFSLSSDSHRILIWRERGSRNHPSNIIERDRYGGRGVLVWGGIMLGSRTDLHIFDAGSINGTRYCNEILLPYVRLFRGAMGLQFLFMDDNAPCHRTVAAEQLFESEDIERMDWLARSPDLNPIEHVWDFLGRRLAARTLPPVTIRELQLALQDEWAAMPQQLIDTVILIMGRRCETCLAVRGDHIPY
ncbi:transposable element Tcb2 transposase [Trichonephila clavipes]|nr:transposable element Tcb2 transposase [Trichonephila clavipes]